MWCVQRALKRRARRQLAGSPRPRCPLDGHRRRHAGRDGARPLHRPVLRRRGRQRELRDVGHDHRPRRRGHADGCRRALRADRQRAARRPGGGRDPARHAAGDVRRDADRQRGVRRDAPDAERERLSRRHRSAPAGGPRVHARHQHRVGALRREPAPRVADPQRHRRAADAGQHRASAARPEGRGAVVRAPDRRARRRVPACRGAAGTGCPPVRTRSCSPRSRGASPSRSAPASSSSRARRPAWWSRSHSVPGRVGPR